VNPSGLSDTSWHTSAAHYRSVVVGVAVVALAVIAGRLDLVVVAVPFVLMAAWGHGDRPKVEPAVEASIDRTLVTEGESTQWQVRFDGGPSSALHLVRFDHPNWITLGSRLKITRADLQYADMEGATWLATANASFHRWGSHVLPPPHTESWNSWHAYRRRQRVNPPVSAFVVPAARLVHPRLDRSIPRGLVGSHRSRVVGRGSEFSHVRGFVPGDRLRQVHWRETLRSGELAVVDTLADQDRRIVIYVDGFDEAGHSGGVNGASSSLDLAVRNAAGLCRHHLGAGDRVELIAASAHGVRHVQSGTGERHLRRLLMTLIAITPSSGDLDSGRVQSAFQGQHHVIYLSPLISAGSVQRLLRLRAGGYAPTVVDCLPRDIVDQQPVASPAHSAWRLTQLKRRDDLDRLRESGIAVVVAQR
jgi:uncharacterized protein (DUF58 family)